MTYTTLKALMSLATAQGIILETTKELKRFAISNRDIIATNPPTPTH